MKSQQDERAALLHEVVRRATDELRAPIERIEVVDGRVDCWSRARRVSLSFSFSQPGYYVNEGVGNTPVPGTFIPYAGSGYWDLWVLEKPSALSEAPKSPIAKILEQRVAIIGAVAIVVCGLIIAAMNRINGCSLDTNLRVPTCTSTSNPSAP